jgi:transcriptional regulator with XRE-family HTH domain
MAVGTTRGKRRLGRFVRPVLERSGLKPDDVAEKAVCSPQTVSRLLSGNALPSRQRFVTILAVIGATDREREHALQLYQVADVDTVAIQHAGELTAKYFRFRLDEAEAVTERTLDTVIVPGLLQTPEYAAAISHSRQRLERSAGWEKRAGDERRERQALLRREPNPIAIHALVHEAAIHTVVGNPEIMTAQLDHLLAMAKLPNVTIQVVPFGYGAHGAMTGPWFLLSFPEPDEPHAAYAESVTGVDTVENAADVAGLWDIWQSIATAAPSPARSAGIIKNVRDGMTGR